MKVSLRTFKAIPYQVVDLPNGAAPLAVEEQRATGFKTDDFQIDPAVKINLYYLGPDNETDYNTTRFGLFVTRTDEPLPNDILLFPVAHPLTNTVEQPNARYVGTVGDRHVFLGNPRK